MPDITVESAEFKRMCNEITNTLEAQKIREEKGERSFREWLYEALNIIATNLGYTIQNLYEYIMDMGHAFKTGYEKGREIARERALRRRGK